MGTTESLLYDENPPSQEFHPSSSSQDRPVNASPTQRRRSSEESSGAQPQRRGRPARPKPIQRIRGLVLGGPRTGKRTLLQRLQGNDPYAANADPKSVPGSITIPYRAPPDAPSWDRIQLQVGRARTLSERVDFVVILVQPTHKLEETKEYLVDVLNSYLGRLKCLSGIPDKSSTEILPPVCISVLINFRDLVESAGVQFQLKEELEEVVARVLKDAGVRDEQVLLQFVSASLRNCYGLNILHNFIYQTYLQRKRAILEAQLAAVKMKIDKTREPELPSYEEFLKLLSPSQAKKAPNKETSPKSDVAENSDSTGKKAASDLNRPSRRQKKGHVSPPSHAEEDSVPKLKGSKAATSGVQPARNGDRRQLLPQNKPMPIGKDALEAFLASDSEEDEQPKSIRSSRHQNPVISSDDEDDDFFYDERGRFNTPAMDDEEESSGSSSEEEYQPTAQSTTKVVAAPSPKSKEAMSTSTPNQARTKLRPDLNLEEAKSAATECTTTTSATIAEKSVPRTDDIQKQPQESAKTTQMEDDAEKHAAEFDAKNASVSKSKTEIKSTTSAPAIPGPSKEDDSDEEEFFVQSADDISREDDGSIIDESPQNDDQGATAIHVRPDPIQVDSAVEALPPIRIIDKDDEGDAESINPSPPETTTIDSPDQSKSVVPVNEENGDGDEADGSLVQDVVPSRNIHGALKKDSTADQSQTHIHKNSTPVASGIEGDSDSDDEEGFVQEDSGNKGASVEATEPTTEPRAPTPKSASTTAQTHGAETLLPSADNDDSDDDEFFVTGEVTSTPLAPPAAPRPTATTAPAEAPPPSPEVTAVAPHSGISVAALAAIEAAQKEAEDMLMQQQARHVDDVHLERRKAKKAKKEKKSKKDGEKKKKKKNDKHKGETNCVSD